MSDLEYSKIKPTETGRYWLISGGVQRVVEVFKDLVDGSLYIEDDSNPFKPRIMHVENMEVQWSEKS